MERTSGHLPGAELLLPYKHNAQFDAGEPLDRTRWASQEERWFDTEYQIESFKQSLVGKTFHAETFPVFTLNLGPSV